MESGQRAGQGRACTVYQRQTKIAPTTPVKKGPKDWPKGEVNRVCVTQKWVIPKVPEKVPDRGW